MIKEVIGNQLYFAKLREGAIIPSRESENAGYDIYACFNEDYLTIPEHTTKMIPTGLCAAFSEDYVMVLKERGSTGTKGMAQRCGIVDSGYRNEIFVPITNTTEKTLWIDKRFTKVEEYNEHIYYPYSKAICQALMVEVPKMNIQEISPEELRSIPSKRGMGNLGSSNK